MQTECARFICLALVIVICGKGVITLTKERTNDIIIYHLGDKERRVKKMALTDAQKRAKAKYNEKVVKVTIELYPTDKDLIDKLQEQTSKQAYIKDLIRKDIQ